MNPHSRVIPFHLNPLGFIEAFTALGAHEAELFAGAGIDPSVLRQPNAKVSYTQQSALIATGMALCRRPGVGLLVGMNFDWTYYGTVGAVVNCSPTLREAGDAFSRYLMISQPYYAMYPRAPLGYVDENAMFTYALRLFPQRSSSSPNRISGPLTAGAIGTAGALFESEFRLATTLRVWDACGNKNLPNHSVHVRLAYPEPAHGDLYRQLPCTSVQFNCETSSIAAHIDFFTTPWRTYRRTAFEQIIRRCEDELNATQLEPSITAKVRWHVYPHFNKPVTLEHICEILHMTPRSLTRRLAREKTTFRDIVHDVRMELTAHHLQSSNMSVEGVAELLGFSSASSLRRAIRNWTGQTAGRLREPKRSPTRAAVHEPSRPRKRKTRT